MILTHLSDSPDTLSDIWHEFLQAATSACNLERFPKIQSELIGS